MLNVMYTVGAVLFFANVALAFFIVLFGRRTPASTWVWLMVLVLLPIAGFFIYLVFGQDIKKSRTFRAKNADDSMLREKFFSAINDGDYKKLYDFQIRAFEEKLFVDNPDFYTVSLNDLVYYNIKVDGGLLTGNNDVRVFNNGSDKFSALFSDIENAGQYIHLLYYIIKDDELGGKLIDLLATKAREGVEVKLCYDGMGCLRTNRRLFKRLTDAGGQVSNFFPPLIPSVNVRLNYRNHRKIAVIDGKIGYIGGINVGNEYIGKSKAFGFWRDMHLRIEGSAVDQLQIRMIMDWNFASDKQMEPDDKYFPIKPDGFTGEKIQIVSSGPDTTHSNIKNVYFKMITEAEKSVYFTTPYFVPDDSILAALKVAALSGIDVRLIFPGRPDHPFVYWASLSYVAELLVAGVKCYQYEKGFIHSKMLVTDGIVSSVGTANMDIRSFALNFETNAVIYSEKIGGILNEQFFSDMNDSFEITEEWYESRPKMYRLKEAFSRLISPIL